MAIWIKWHPTQEAAWAEWVASRPQEVQDTIKKYSIRPDKLYWHKAGDRANPARVRVLSVSEEGTVRIDYSALFNSDNVSAMLMGPLWEREVFGVDPAELSECEWDGTPVDGHPM